MEIGYAELKVRVFIININYHELSMNYHKLYVKSSNADSG